MRITTAPVAAAISRALDATRALPTPAPTYGARQRTAAAKKRAGRRWPGRSFTVATMADGTAYVSWELGPSEGEVRTALGACFEAAVYTRSTGELF